MDAGDAVIIETDEAPRIERISENFSTVIFPENMWSTGMNLTEWDSHYVIYVPKGSITPMINMDLPGSDND